MIQILYKYYNRNTYIMAAFSQECISPTPMELENPLNMMHRIAPSTQTMILTTLDEQNTVGMCISSTNGTRSTELCVRMPAFPFILIDGKKLFFVENNLENYNGPSTLEQIIQTIKNGSSSRIHYKQNGLILTDPTEYNYSLDDEGHVMAVLKKFEHFVDLS